MKVGRSKKQPCEFYLVSDIKERTDERVRIELRRVTMDGEGEGLLKNAPDGE